MVFQVGIMDFHMWAQGRRSGSHVTFGLAWNFSLQAALCRMAFMTLGVSYNKRMRVKHEYATFPNSFLFLPFLIFFIEKGFLLPFYC